MVGRKGFTLIELLVVIAIIAILAAILFPVFARAKNAANTTKCCAHGRQVGEATLMYMNDFNGKFPTDAPGAAVAAADAKFGVGNYNWFGYQMQTGTGMAQWRFILLRPYVKNDNIWICPDPHTNYAKRYAYGYRISWLPRSSDDFVDGDRGFMKDAWINGENRGVGRSIEEVMGLDMKGETACGKRYLPPAKKIMWMCYALGEWANGGKVGYGYYPWVFPSYAHKMGSVFVYADGHAAYKDMGRGWAPIGYTTLEVDRKPSGGYQPT